MTDSLHEGRYTFLSISRSVLLRMGDVSDKVSKEIKTYILCAFFENGVIY